MPFPKTQPGDSNPDSSDPDSEIIWWSDPDSEISWWSDPDSEWIWCWLIDGDNGDSSPDFWEDKCWSSLAIVDPKSSSAFFFTLQNQGMEFS